MRTCIPKESSLYLVCLSIIALLLAACSHNPARIPEAQPVPLFRKQGDVHLAAAYQSEKGMQGMAGMAVAPSVSAFAAGAYGQQDNCFTCSKDVARHAEAAVGSYRKLGDRFTGEAYLGGGLGRFRTLGNSGEWDPAPEDITVSAGRYYAGFLQGNIGRTGTWFDQAVSTRLSVYRFHDFRQWDGNEIPLSAPSRHVGVFLEPAFTLGLGYKQIKATGQLGFSLPLVQADGLDNPVVRLSLGLGYSLFRE